MFDAGRLLGTSEPIVNAMAGLDSLTGSPCGRSRIRVTPQRFVTPCVYWPHRDLTIDDLGWPAAAQVLESEHFRRSRLVPEICRDCHHVASCGGGCPSRRALLGDLSQPDIYCPIARGDTVDLAFSPASEKDLPRGKNVCTTVILP